MKNAALTLTVLVFSVSSISTAEPTKRTSREALQAFNDLIGEWRAVGRPEGTREEKQKGFWQETLDWSWRLKGNDAWLNVSFAKGKYFDQGELRYLSEGDLFELKVLTPAKETLIFQGRLTDRCLTLERKDEKQQETQRLIITLLHANRFLYRYEVKPQSRAMFKRLYEVGATKEGVPFAGPGDTSPECMVSGGKGTIAVPYKGKTYYVCCSGCRDAFREEPEKYIKEFEEKKAQAAKDKGR
jgi:YHS domain-containing protein